MEKKKSVVRTVRRRSNRKNKSATDFNGDVESSMCDKQVGTSTQTKVTKDAQTSMELVKFAGELFIYLLIYINAYIKFIDVIF